MYTKKNYDKFNRMAEQIEYYGNESTNIKKIDDYLGTDEFLHFREAFGDPRLDTTNASLVVKVANCIRKIENGE